MENNIHIRQIEQKDNAALANIIRKTLEEFGANHPGTVYYDESTDRLSTLFTVPGSAYFIAEQNGQILGGGGIYPTEGLPHGTCELVKMYLFPQARGKGLGITLLQKCLEFARNNGYKNVYLETMPELKLAIGLYQKFGFKRITTPLGQSGHSGCNIWMILNLDDNS
jgi:putative acetyltransferase